MKVNKEASELYLKNRKQIIYTGLDYTLMDWTNGRSANSKIGFEWCGEHTSQECGVRLTNSPHAQGIMLHHCGRTSQASHLSIFSLCDLIKRPRVKKAWYRYESITFKNTRGRIFHSVHFSLTPHRLCLCYSFVTSILSTIPTLPCYTKCHVILRCKRRL